jgi:hypothetical protein
MNLVKDVGGALSQRVVKPSVNGASASNRATDANDRNDGDDGDKRESCDLASGACEERLNAAFRGARCASAAHDASASISR